MNHLLCRPGLFGPGWCGGSKRTCPTYVLAALLIASSASAQTLTLKQAEEAALQHHPQIQQQQASAKAAAEVVREAKSSYYPTVFGSVTGAEAQNASRIAAGGLNNPVIYDRFATGVTVGQLITDFGRTHALADSASLSAQAQDSTVTSRRADVLVRVDRAYFNVLRAQAVQRVAHDTVSTRQVVVDQVTALAASNLKSGLDVSFANVNLSEARLLLVQAQNDLKSADADLAAAMGSATDQEYSLAEEPQPPPPPQDEAALIAAAMRDRPEVAAARFSSEAVARFADAEGGLSLPSISAVGVFGAIPYRQDTLNDRYAAVGVNLNVPVFNGSLYPARHAEAMFRAEAERQRLLDIQNQISRDVRVAWLDARSTFERLALTDQLLEQATQALDLAQARYNLGLSSIVELTQGQLSKTQAEIAQASARFEYQTRTAVLKYQTGALR
ncbi:MAG: TolC family protein [Acidobacteria bacterium]|nr:TolC family protein [Acidobacteriota bacterium]